MSNLDKEFVPYAQALELKEIGFDEPCLAFYNSKYLESTEYDFFWKTSRDIGSCYKTPTFSQAFRWFREKYGLHSYIEGAYPWFRFYINSDDNRWEGFKHLTFEEAELACLKKLIEIAKNKLI